MARETLKDGQLSTAKEADWHADPNCSVDFVPNVGNGGLYIVCKTHRVAADLEAVGTRITHEASRK